MPTPVGQIRYNPRSGLTEMWDGKSWATQTFATLGASSLTSAPSVSSVKPSYSATERELMFDFLKRNLRVAEYRDGDGKIENVELQIRLDDGYSWESIRREKIIRSKSKL